MRAWRLAGTLALALAVPTASTPQEEPAQSRYDYMYGSPVEVSVDDLLQMGATAYANRAVRTKGALEMPNPVQGRTGGYALTGTFGAQLEINPVAKPTFECKTDPHRSFPPN